MSVSGVAPDLLDDMLQQWDESGPTLVLALLKSRPSATAGVWDITGCELTDPGYSRGTLPMADLAVQPAALVSEAVIVFGVNGTADRWTPAGFVAILANGGTETVTVVQLPALFVVMPHSVAVIAVGDLQLVAA